MGLIYEPRGRAREYAKLACNIYKGCGHGCTYCFAPGATHKTKEEFLKPAPRSEHFLGDLVNEARKRQEKGRVLLCFTCDPYQPLDDDLRLTRETIKFLHAFDFRVTILTKGGKRALRDIGLYMKGDAFATTLTLINDNEIRQWEPGAASFFDRVQAMREFHAAGVMTWVSLEPVIQPSTTLEIIKMTYRHANAYKVGTLNHHPLAKEIDWRKFAQDTIALLDQLGYTRQMNPDSLGKSEYYIKRDLSRWLE